MAELKGFWSYVHADDDADSGRVARLAKDVAAQFEMLTGEKIDLFLDRDDIAWGEDWRGKIDESLSSIAFFPGTHSTLLHEFRMPSRAAVLCAEGKEPGN